MQLLRAHILNFNHCLKREKIGEAAFCTAIPNAYCRFIALWPGQSKWIAVGHVYVFIVESVMAEKVHSFTLLNPDPHNSTRHLPTKQPRLWIEEAPHPVTTTLCCRWINSGRLGWKARWNLWLWWNEIQQYDSIFIWARLFCEVVVQQ